MTPRNSAFAEVRAAFMLLDTMPTVLALECVNLLGVTRLGESSGESPIPFGTLVPTEFAVPEPESVLRIAFGHHYFATLISGTIRVEHFPTSALIEMPTRTLAGFRLFSNILLADDKPFALVVNIDAISRLRPELG